MLRAIELNQGICRSHASCDGTLSGVADSNVASHLPTQGKSARRGLVIPFDPDEATID